MGCLKVWRSAGVMRSGLFVSRTYWAGVIVFPVILLCFRVGSLLVYLDSTCCLCCKIVASVAYIIFKIEFSLLSCPFLLYLPPLPLLSIQLALIFLSAMSKTGMHWISRCCCCWCCWFRWCWRRVWSRRGCRSRPLPPSPPPSASWRLGHDDDDSSSTMTHSVYDVQFSVSKIEEWDEKPSSVYEPDSAFCKWWIKCDIYIWVRSVFSGPTICRLLYVGNLPSHVTEASIKEAFPDALQVIIPYDEETMERTG